MQLEINLIFIDEDEKVRNNIPTLGCNQEALFLTENVDYTYVKLFTEVPNKRKKFNSCK